MKNKLSELKLSQRELELWLPVLAVAVFLEKHGVSLLENLLKFLEAAVQESRETDVAESRDVALITALLRNVTKDDFYSTSTIKEWVRAEVEEEDPRWLTTTWVGRALRRIGVREKRKVRNRNEWRLSKSLVLTIAKRYVASLELDEELKNKLQEFFKVNGTNGASGTSGVTRDVDISGRRVVVRRLPEAYPGRLSGGRSSSSLPYLRSRKPSLKSPLSGSPPP